MRTRNRYQPNTPIRLEGEATVWDDLRFPAQSVRLKSLKEPEWRTFLGNTDTLQFKKDAENTAVFQVQFPHAWKQGSALRPHIHWAPMDTDTGSVIWYLEYTMANINGTFGETTTISVTDAADGTAYKHQLCEFSPIVMTGMTFSSMMICSLYRDGGEGADDYDEWASLLEMDFHIEFNSMGSEQEYYKA